MPKEKDQLPRRDFLKRASQAALAAAASGCAASAAAPRDDGKASADWLPSRALGKTGAELPILGFGGAALPREWHNPLSLEERIELVRYAHARGVRYFDTAANYMESQTILGKALKDLRDKVYLVTKVETTVTAEVRRDVEKSLKELQTDHLDALLIHGTPGLEQMNVEQAMKIHAELVKLRDEGITKSIGFSAHGYFDKALALISTGGFDLCMLSLGYLPRGHNQIFSARTVELRNTCVAKAHERGMGIVAMKVVGGGVLGAWSRYIVPEFDGKRLKNLPAAAIRHVLQDKRIHLLAIGMRLRQEIDANIRTLSGETACTTDDRALLAEFCAKALDSESIRKMKVE